MHWALVFVTFTSYVSAELNRVQVSPKFIQDALNNGLAKAKNNLIPNEDSDTYLDKPDNQMVVPVPGTFQEHKEKKKLYKKLRSPIQKIIARNKKNKKARSNHLTTSPPQPPDSDEFVEEFVEERDNDPTTQANLKKKVRKWNRKQSKYHAQIQKMPNRVSPKHKRTRRNTERDNTIIFQDFDEFEFLDKKKDYDIVRTHYKKYW